MRDESKIKLLLGGNQVGKTMAACAELIHRCLGTHPYIQTDPPPIQAFLITHSHQQSITIQEKLYNMCPKNELHPDCEFVPGRGFRGIHPVIRFRNGSLIMVKTANQGLGLASSTISYVAIDEPVGAEVWGELAARVLRGGAGGKTGTIGITMTPVGQDVSYLKKLVDDGTVSCHNAPLTVEQTTPIGLAPLIAQSTIDRIAQTYLPIDRAARLNGDWAVGVPEGRVFDQFDDNMISSLPAPPGGQYEFGIGVDHGSQPNAQVAILAAINMADPEKPIVYVLDEYTSGAATPEAHARAILEMCQRNQIDPAACRWTGDNIHYGGSGGAGKMSNSLLMRAFEKILQYPPNGLPWRIRTVRKPRYSVYHGAALIHSIQARKNFFIHPRCQRTIMSLQRWTMKRNQSLRSRDEYGHCIDALRYTLVPTIDVKYKPPTAQIRFY